MTKALKRHKGAEQRARKNWGNRQNAAYDYRDDSDIEYQIPTKTRRTDGSRERALPKRSKKVKLAKEICQCLILAPTTLLPKALMTVFLTAVCLLVKS